MSQGTADLTLSPSPEVAPEDAPKMRRNVSVLAGSQLITWTMTLLWTLVVPRTLGPTNMGTLMAAWAVTGILGRARSGSGRGTTSCARRSSVPTPHRGSSARLSSCVWPCRRSSSGPRSPTARSSVGTATRRPCSILAAAATIFVQIAEPLQAGFQAIERMEYLAYSDIISKSGQGLVGHRRRAVGLPDDRHHSLLGRDDRAGRAAQSLLASRAPPDRREDERQADGRGRARPASRTGRSACSSWSISGSTS